MKTLSNKFLLMLILFSIIFSTSPILAQLTSEKISELEKQTNFKIIRFSVYGINTPADAMKLKSLLEAKNGILSCETDLKNNQCTIFASFVIQKKDIVALTGPAGIKTSNFSEEIHLKKIPAKKNTMTERQVFERQHPQEKEIYENRRSQNTYMNESSFQLKCVERTIKPNNQSKMNPEERLIHIEELRKIAIERGTSTDKYDKAIKELKKK